MFRLKEARLNCNLSQKKLSDMIGVSRTTISMWETSSSQPDNDMLVKLSAILGVSVDFLLSNDNSIDLGSNTLDLAKYGLMPIKTKKFPLLGEIACGVPIFADEDNESYILAGTDIKADFCLRAKGDSMINARILDGDIVFIRKQPIVENGEIAAVIIDDTATLKRVYYYPQQGKLLLSAENPAYEPLMYVGEELEHITILGKAVAFQSDVR